MNRRSTLSRRLAGISGAAVCLIVLTLLWQLRPPLAPLPHTVSALFSAAFIGDAIRILLWLTLAALALVLLARSLRLGAGPKQADANAVSRSGKQSARPRARRPNQPPVLDGVATTGPTGKQTALASESYVPSWGRPRLTLSHREEEPTLTPSAATDVAVRPPPGGHGAVPPAAEPVQGETAVEQTRPRVLLLGPIEIPTRRKPRRRAPGPAHELVAYLALHPEGASRDQLLEALWPNENPQRSEQRFWQASKEARQLLGGCIVRDSGRYQLDRNQVELDIEELERLLAQANEAADELAEHDLLEQALALFRGEPLEGSDYLWADGPRRGLAATHLELLDRVAHARLVIGDARGALDAAEQALAAENLNEGFWRLALEAEAATGSREAVAERYETLRQLLDERLGLQPDRETRTLYRRLLSQA